MQLLAYNRKAQRGQQHTLVEPQQKVTSQLHILLPVCEKVGNPVCRALVMVLKTEDPGRIQMLADVMEPHVDGIIHRSVDSVGELQRGRPDQTISGFFQECQARLRHPNVFIRTDVMATGIWSLKPVIVAVLRARVIVEVLKQNQNNPYLNETDLGGLVPKFLISAVLDCTEGDVVWTSSISAVQFFWKGCALIS